VSVPVGVNVVAAEAKAVPPELSAYQSIVSPAPTLAVKAGVVAPSQILGAFGFVGALTVAHEQLGAVTDCVVAQFVVVFVAVKVIFVPVGIPLTVKFGLVPETVPAVEESVLALLVTVTV
jgi:hypothetical protein